MARFWIVIALFCGMWACGGTPKPPRNVLLISLDTLRGDRLGSYGYPRKDISPALDQLAREGFRFEQAISHSPWTTPSHMSLLTSTYPSTHRVTQSWTLLARRFEGETLQYRGLPESAVTLAEALHDNGFETLALTGGGTMLGDLGFNQGFESYLEAPDSLDRRKRLTIWLEQPRDRPFFLFLHTFEIHAPYQRPRYVESLLDSDQHTRLQQLLETAPDIDAVLPDFLGEEGLFIPEITSALYDGGVRYADDALGWLFAELERTGLTDETLIVVTSDHGEEFAERKPDRYYGSHCETVYDELIRVPLLIRSPDRVDDADRAIEAQVELIDVAPTILDLLGVPQPATWQGHSLEPLMSGAQPDGESWALSEATCYGPEIKSLRSNRYKYIAAFEADDLDRSGLDHPLLWEELYDLKADPGERRDLEESNPALLVQAREMLLDRLRVAQSLAAPESPSTPVTPQTMDRLRSLGYIQ